MKRRIAATLLIAAGTTPVTAQDTAEKVGIAAALGLTAGTGKTTLQDGAGSIEAALLNTDAMDHAGRIIAGVVNGRNLKGPILVVSRDEKVDLITGLAVRRRLKTLTDAVNKVDPNACGKVVTETTTVATRAEGIAKNEAGQPKTVRRTFDLSDITAALATDVTIATVDVNVEDRMLIQSVAMNGSTSGFGGAPVWTSITLLDGNSGTGSFLIPDEVSAVKPGAEPQAKSASATLNAYEAMLAAADSRRHCARDDAKAVVGAADSYAVAINKNPEKGGASPLGQAIQTDAFGPAAPMILRVAAEDAGGTSIVSANIWYTLGFPGAATISSGLIASFRLVDPTTGGAIVAGMVRCATRSMNIKRGQAMIAEDRTGRRTSCAYRTSG